MANERVVVVNPKDVAFGNRDGNVTMVFGTGLSQVPHVGLALTPHEARWFAEILNRQADQAEGLQH